VVADAVERRAGTDRRVGRVSFRYPERRSGFDRRVPDGGAGLRVRMLDAYRARPRLVAAVLACIVIANAADLAFTFAALNLGASELNPVMAGLIGIDPLVAAGFKLAVTVAVTGGIWALRRYRRVLEASLVVLGTMAGLMLYHAVVLFAVV
jgi:hypothetical protein